MKVSNFIKYLILLLSIVNNSYTMDFDDNKPLNSRNMQTRINLLYQQYSDAVIALVLQLECEGYNPNNTIFEINNIYKNYSSLKGKFLVGKEDISEQSLNELKNELEKEKYGYLFKYYNAISDIFKLRQDRETLKKCS